MTMNDAFDERLKAAFARAAESLETEKQADAFAHRVVTRLSNPGRKRFIMLGGAGSTGSAVAGTQLEGVLSNVQVPTEGLMANAAFLMSPEVMAAAAIAIAVGTVATILPKRIA
jgi:putative NADH-flavin reductase